MNRIIGLVFKLAAGVVIVEWLAGALSPGGALNGLTGMLIARYPFHRYLAEVFSDTLGYDISFVPAVGTSVLDDAVILLIAVLISSGVAGVLKNIFNPVDTGAADAKAYVRGAGYQLHGLTVTALAGVVTILFSNMVFGSIIQWVNASGIPKIIWKALEMAVIIGVLALFAVFVSAMAGAASGSGFSFGLFAFFAVRAVIGTVLAVVVSVWALLAIVNHARDAAVWLIGIYAILILVSTAASGLRA